MNTDSKFILSGAWYANNLSVIWVFGIRVSLTLLRVSILIKLFVLPESRIPLMVIQLPVLFLSFALNFGSMPGWASSWPSVLSMFILSNTLLGWPCWGAWVLPSGVIPVAGLASDCALSVVCCWACCLSGVGVRAAAPCLLGDWLNLLPEVGLRDLALWASRLFFSSLTGHTTMAWSGCRYSKHWFKLGHLNTVCPCFRHLRHRPMAVSLVFRCSMSPE